MLVFSATRAAFCWLSAASSCCREPPRLKDTFRRWQPAPPRPEARFLPRRRFHPYHPFRPLVRGTVTSPMIPPTPRPPHRSIAGPVVLILMGVLFLLGTMGILEWHGFGTLFARFWGALFVLWGVLKLIEYEQAKRLGQPARGIGVGGVFLMLFLIGAGLIATQAARLNWKSIGEHIQIGDNEDLDEIFGGSTFNYSDELSQDIPAGSTLHVNDDRGAITINVADGKTMKVSVRKKVRAEKEQDANNYNSKTKPQIFAGDKVVTLNANTQGAGDKGVPPDMDIYVPVNTALVITTSRGDDLRLGFTVVVVGV